MVQRQKKKNCIDLTAFASLFMTACPSKLRGSAVSKDVIGISCQREILTRTTYPTRRMLLTTPQVAPNDQAISNSTVIRTYNKQDHVNPTRWCDKMRFNEMEERLSRTFTRKRTNMYGTCLSPASKSIYILYSMYRLLDFQLGG